MNISEIVTHMNLWNSIHTIEILSLLTKSSWGEREKKHNSDKISI